MAKKNSVGLLSKEQWNCSRSLILQRAFASFIKNVESFVKKAVHQTMYKDSGILGPCGRECHSALTILSTSKYST